MRAKTKTQRRTRAKTKTQRRTRGPTKIRKTELVRAVDSMRAAGLSVRSVEVDSVNSKFTMLIGDAVPKATNSWDDAIDAKDEKRPA